MPRVTKTKVLKYEFQNVDDQEIVPVGVMYL
jgi:hypothetical protein